MAGTDCEQIYTKSIQRVAKDLPVVIDGIQGAVGVKIIKPREVPNILARDEPAHGPRTHRTWSFTLIFGALKSLSDQGG